MKIIKSYKALHLKVFIGIVMSILSSFSFSANRDEMMEQLQNVTFFSLGLNGFVGKISDGEKIYKDILSSQDGENKFLLIVHDSKSTPESKLYAACGLKALKRNNMNVIFKNNFNNKVTVLKGDVLSQRSFHEVYLNILKNGCSE